MLAEVDVSGDWTLSGGEVQVSVQTATTAAAACDSGRVGAIKHSVVSDSLRIGANKECSHSKQGHYAIHGYGHGLATPHYGYRNTLYAATHCTIWRIVAYNLVGQSWSHGRAKPGYQSTHHWTVFGCLNSHNSVL
jgi:hypothetical protein